MDESLGTKSGEQTLSDPLLQMQMDRVLGEHARVLEDDWTDWRLAAPVGDFLILLARLSERVQGSEPTRVRLGTPAQRRKGPDSMACFISGLGERRGAEQFKGT